MSNTKKTTHVLGKIKQLIDLNGDSINFNLNFKVQHARTRGYVSRGLHEFGNTRTPESANTRIHGYTITRIRE